MADNRDGAGVGHLETPDLREHRAALLDALRELLVPELHGRADVVGDVFPLGRPRAEAARVLMPTPQPRRIECRQELL